MMEQVKIADCVYMSEDNFYSALRACYNNELSIVEERLGFTLTPLDLKLLVLSEDECCIYTQGGSDPASLEMEYSMVLRQLNIQRALREMELLDNKVEKAFKKRFKKLLKSSMQDTGKCLDEVRNTFNSLDKSKFDSDEAYKAELSTLANMNLAYKVLNLLYLKDINRCNYFIKHGLDKKLTDKEMNYIIYNMNDGETNDFIRSRTGSKQDKDMFKQYICKIVDDYNWDLYRGASRTSDRYESNILSCLIKKEQASAERTLRSLLGMDSI